MTTTIITKNSSTASAVPLAADLVQGELAVNVIDKKLYTKNASGSIVEVSPTVIDNASITQAKLASNVAGNGPAFSAYPNASTSLTNNTYTKVLFQVEDFDTNNNFTGSTFTPTVAGYYQVNATVAGNFLAGQNLIALYKNGSRVKIAQDITTAVYSLTGSWLVYCNGSTDFIEIYIYQSGGSTVSVVATAIDTYLQASMVRAA